MGIVCFGKKAPKNVIKKLLGGGVLLTSDCRVFSYKYNSVDKGPNLDLQRKTLSSDSLFLVPHYSVTHMIFRIDHNPILPEGNPYYDIGS